jgi:hypothetical protein
VLAEKEGDTFRVDIPALEDRYDLSVYFAQGPNYGSADILHNGVKVGELRGYNRDVVPGGMITLKDLRSVNRMIPLHFVLTGRESRSSGHVVGLDAFVLEPHRTFIPEWYLIGPFPNPRDENSNRLGLDIAYPPEKEFDPEKSYPGVDQKPVRWALEKTPPNGRVDLYKFDPYELVVVYALTHIFSPKDQTLPLLLGTDDGAKVFLNDKEIYRLATVRISVVDHDRVMLDLKKGWNKLLLKIENNYGGYNFYARVLDLEDSLVFSPGKRK